MSFRPTQKTKLEPHQNEKVKVNEREGEEGGGRGGREGRREPTVLQKGFSNQRTLASWSLNLLLCRFRVTPSALLKKRSVSSFSQISLTARDQLGQATQKATLYERFEPHSLLQIRRCRTYWSWKRSVDYPKKLRKNSRFYWQGDPNKPVPSDFGRIEGGWRCGCPLVGSLGI